MMHKFSDTIIGNDYLSKKGNYDTDLLLDFLSLLIKMRSTADRDLEQYNREIEAVKVLLGSPSPGPLIQ